MSVTDRAVLNVNGKPFDKGWDEIRVSSSMDALSITFDFTCTQQRPFNRAEWEIQMGSVCSVSMGGQLLATGYIEDIDIDYNATSHTVHVSGRDKLADIVDSASDGTVLHWKASSARTIIAALVKPFGITLVVDPKVKALMNEAISPQTLQGGDGVFDIIMKILKLQGTVGIAMADGNLLVTEAGAYNGKEYRATDKIESGVNVIRGALKQSDKDRFQYYFTKGYSESIDTAAGKHLSYFDKFKDTGDAKKCYMYFRMVSKHGMFSS